jgi:hypothetical protein
MHKISVSKQVQGKCVISTTEKSTNNPETLCFPFKSGLASNTEDNNILRNTNG